MTFSSSVLLKKVLATVSEWLEQNSIKKSRFGISTWYCASIPKPCAWDHLLRFEIRRFPADHRNLIGASGINERSDIARSMSSNFATEATDKSLAQMAVALLVVEPCLPRTARSDSGMPNLTDQLRPADFRESEDITGSTRPEASTCNPSNDGGNILHSSDVSPRLRNVVALTSVGGLRIGPCNFPLKDNPHSSKALQNSTIKFALFMPIAGTSIGRDTSPFWQSL